MDASRLASRCRAKSAAAAGRRDASTCSRAKWSSCAPLQRRCAPGDLNRSQACSLRQHQPPQPLQPPCQMPQRRALCCAASDAPAVTPSGDDGQGRMKWPGLVFAAGILAAIGISWQVESLRLPAITVLTKAHVYLQRIPGFLESFSLIFMVELGDKTFFIAALLAMRFGKLLSFVGSVLSLGFMTIVSVAIGNFLGQVPQFVNSSLPIGQYLGAALLFFFGYRSIRAGLNASAGDSELKDAEEELGSAEKSGKIAGKTRLAAFWEVASLIFIAEWGDRSMLATIGLAVHKSAVGVAVGATLGHAVATIIAVVAGSLASKWISERTVNLIGGVLFLLFGLETALGLGIL